MSVTVVRITERKCATCRWWEGPRRVKFSGNKPYYVEATAGNFPCSAYSHKTTTPGNCCIRHEPWEKL